jgi:hypothetical protein
LWSVLLCAFGLVVAALPAATTADAASPIVVTMEGPRGHLVARAADRTIELSLDGRQPVTLTNAQIVVTRSRITVSGRNKQQTLVAWSNRATGAGGIGVLIRTGRKMPDRIGFFPTSVEVEGEPPPQVRTAR